MNRFDQNFHPGDWSIDVPRPTFAAWIGDTWRIGSQLTINYGIRWDDDWGVASPPNVVTNEILLNNNAAAAPTNIPGLAGTDFGYKTGIYDHRNVAPPSRNNRVSDARKRWGVRWQSRGK